MRLALLLPLLVAACSSPTPAPAPDLTATCCQECVTASQTDPTAADLSLVPCADYATHIVNGEPALSEGCRAWFGEHPKLVQDCR